MRQLEGQGLDEGGAASTTLVLEAAEKVGMGLGRPELTHHPCACPAVVAAVASCAVVVLVATGADVGTQGRFACRVSAAARQ